MKFSTRIMIVDDEEMICESLEAWFVRDGYQVATAIVRRGGVATCRGFPRRHLSG